MYGIITFILYKNGFTIGGSFSFHNLIVEPFIGGHQFVYNFPSWFVPALFIVQVVNMAIRKVFAIIRLNFEWLLFVIYFIFGMININFAMKGYNTGYILPVVRTFYLLPFFELGYLYKSKLENKDNISNFKYFSIILIIQLIMMAKYNDLDTSAVWCNQFLNGAVVAYISAATGIFFWLRISKFITPLFKNNKYVIYAGTHTFDIMMHHIFVFMVVKVSFYVLQHFIDFQPVFDTIACKTNIWYYYLVSNLEVFKFVYLVLGIIIPLLLRYFIDNIKKNIFRN